MNRFNIPSNLICPLSKSKHILRGPQKLPCRRTACLACIKALVRGTKDEFQCSLCSHRHTLRSLGSNRICEIQIDDDLAKLGSYESNRLELASESTRDLFSTAQGALDGLFEFYRYEMDIRFEALRSEIDVKAGEVETSIRASVQESWDNIEANFLKEEFKWDGRKFQKSEDILQKLQSIDIKIFTILKKGNNLQGLKTYKAITFFNQPTTSNELAIGKLIDPCAENIITPLSVKLTRFINLDFNAHDICSYQICQLLITDPTNNCLHIFHTNSTWTDFRPVRTITNIDGTPLTEPTSIAVDMERKCVYLCVNRSTILVTDISLEKILASSTVQIMHDSSSSNQTGEDTASEICEMLFQNGSLFILDRTASLFKVKYISAAHNEDSENPVIRVEKINILIPVSESKSSIKHLAVSSLQSRSIQIAIGARSSILVYNEGESTDSVEVRIQDGMRTNSMVFCEDGAVLFVHLSCTGCDRLVCFTRSDDGREWWDSHQITLEDEIVSSVKMCYVNGHLVVVSVGRYLVVF